LNYKLNFDELQPIGANLRVLTILDPSKKTIPEIHVKKLATNLGDTLESLTIATGIPQNQKKKNLPQLSPGLTCFR